MTMSMNEALVHPDWDNLVHLLRMHSCMADAAMTVGCCVDTGRCGCSVGLAIGKISEREQQEIEIMNDQAGNG